MAASTSVILVLLVALASQATCTTLEGTVSIDCSGDIIYLFNITVQVTAGSQTYAATTDSDGFFTLAGLPSSTSAKIAFLNLPYGIVSEESSLDLEGEYVVVSFSLADNTGVKVPPYYETQCGSTGTQAAGEAEPTGYCPGSMTYHDDWTYSAFFLITLRTWRFTIGNEEFSANQLIMSQDTIAPTLTVPAVSSNYECDGSVPPPQGEPTVTDNCGYGMPVKYVDVVSLGCPINVTRTWMTVDGSGNTAQQVQFFQLVDTTSPILTAPPSYVGPCSGVGAWLESNGGAVATDSCSPSVSIDTFASLCVNNTIATIVATDGCGNTASASVPLVYTVFDCDECIIDDECQ